MRNEYWISAHDQYGNLFWDTIEADTDDEMFQKFKERNHNCEIADYGRYEVDDSYTLSGEQARLTLEILEGLTMMPYEELNRKYGSVTIMRMVELRNELSAKYKPHENEEPAEGAELEEV